MASIAVGPIARAQDPTGTPTPSFQADPELEALFPTSVGGQPLEVGSMMGADLLAMAGNESSAAQMDDALASQGKSLADVSIALAFGDQVPVMVSAVRVKGGDPSALLPVIIGTFGEGVTQAPGQVAGKEVVVLTEPSGTLVYIYLKDDILWAVTAEEPLLSEILGTLP